jgi:hypothetical protein
VTKYNEPSLPSHFLNINFDRLPRKRRMVGSKNARKRETQKE